MASLGPGNRARHESLERGVWGGQRNRSTTDRTNDSIPYSRVASLGLGKTARADSNSSVVAAGSSRSRRRCSISVGIGAGVGLGVAVVDGSS